MFQNLSIQLHVREKSSDRRTCPTYFWFVRRMTEISADQLSDIILFIIFNPSDIFILTKNPKRKPEFRAKFAKT